MSQDADSVSLTLADAHRVSADVVVGADGVHSVLRDTVTTVEPARFTGHVAYRMLIPRSDMPSGNIPPPAVVIRLGRHGHVVGYWVKGGDIYNVVAVAEDDRWHEESWRTRAEIDEVRAAFRTWDRQLRSLIDNARDIYKWALLDHSVPTDWTHDRVALLGDSCHAMLPYLAQGGAMAIEDAWVLAASLAASTQPAEGLRRYSRQRAERVTRVHSGATRNARLFHLSGPRRAARNARLWMLGRRPQNFISGMDWLYGHNVTAAPST